MRLCRKKKVATGSARGIQKYPRGTNGRRYSFGRESDKYK
jgi:hypothetical protein